MPSWVSQRGRGCGRPTLGRVGAAARRAVRVGSSTATEKAQGQPLWGQDGCLRQEKTAIPDELVLGEAGWSHLGRPTKALSDPVSKTRGCSSHIRAVAHDMDEVGAAPVLTVDKFLRSCGVQTVTVTHLVRPYRPPGPSTAPDAD